MSPELIRESGGSVARQLAFRLIRLGTKKACGLVSCCGHHGLLITLSRCKRSRKTRPATVASPQLPLTERFGQDIFAWTDRKGRVPSKAFPKREIFQRS
jgi:hypothetical protein